MFRMTLNRRYRARFQVGEVAMSPMEELVQPKRWLTYGCALGRVGVALERKVVLSIMAYRYGLADGNGQAEPPRESEHPETATEERLAAMLCQQFVNLLAARIEAGLAPHDTQGAKDVSQRHAFNAVSPVAPSRGTWVIRVNLEELAHGIEGVLHFALDDAWMARLLQNIGPARDKPGDAASSLPEFAGRLQLTLAARLLKKDILLGELLDIRVGDVIPVSFGSADVLIDDSRLFSASIAEHKGKLCLTSFEDAE